MGRPPIGKAAMTGAERVQRYRLKHGTGKPVTKTVTKSATESDAEDRIKILETELARERHQTALATAEIAELKTELARARQRRAVPEVRTRADPAPLPPTEAERTIKRLRERNRAANNEIRHLRTWAKTTGLPERGGMSLTTYRTIMKILHPDRQLSATELKEEQEVACKVFNIWVDSLRPARRQ